MSVEEANAICTAAEHGKFMRQAVQFAEGKEETSRMKELLSKSSATTGAETALIAGLRARLDAAIGRFAPDGAFVKLSTRSPKDAALESHALRSQITRELVPVAGGSTTDEEYERLAINAFIRASVQTLRVTSGEQAIALLVASQRVQQDITRLRLAQDGQFSLSMAVRRWDSHVVPEWEFRCFCYDKVMTAATAYYKLVHVPEIAANRERIGKILVEYHDRIKDRIPMKSYTVDIAVQPDLSGARMIEINNLPPTAGTALFDWDSEADRKEIENLPFKLRVTTSTPPGALEEIHPPVRALIRQIRSLRGAMPTTHIGFCCDVCRGPIEGSRFKCSICPVSFDLCSRCWNAGAAPHHPRDHPFVRFDDPITLEPTAVGPSIIQAPPPPAAAAQEKKEGGGCSLQ